MTTGKATAAIPGKVVELSELPLCDICKMYNLTPVKQAAYDFKIVNGPWAYGCTTHYRQFRAYTTLGVGMGQKLLLRTVANNEQQQ